MDLLRKLAVAMSRTSDEARRSMQINPDPAKYALFFGFFLALTMVFAPVFLHSFMQWEHFKADLDVPASAWRYLYRLGNPCPDLALENQNCPAHPHAEALWQSPDRVFNAEKLRAGGSEGIWLGAILSSRFLGELRRLQSHYLLLKKIKSPFKAWINGELVLERKGAESLYPALIDVPMRKLDSIGRIYMAVRVMPGPQGWDPEILSGDLTSGGFVTGAGAANYWRLLAFRNQTRPFSLLLAYSIIAILFFCIWIPHKDKQEYFYIALYALVSAMVQARKIDMISSAFSFRALAIADTFLIWYSACFGMILGLSFARTKRLFFGLCLPVLLVLPAFAALPGSERFRDELNGALRLWLYPICYAIGAGACFLQAYYLWDRKKTGSHLPIRVNRLALFGVGLLVLGVFYSLHSRRVFPESAFNLWLGFNNLPCMLFIGAIALKEYGEQARSTSKIPVSEYHSRSVLPSSVFGAVLMVDLKFSEPFYRHRAHQNNAENLVSIWRSHFYTSVLKHEGTVIYKKGDELIAFFDKEKAPSPVVVRAIQSVEEMTRVSGLLEAELRRQNRFPPDAKGFYFRASLTLGALKPVWETFGQAREASWEEAGETSSLVEASRLLDLEKSLAPREEMTLLIMPERLRQAIVSSHPELASGFISKNRVLRGKHGAAYSVAAYHPVKSDGI